VSRLLDHELIRKRRREVGLTSRKAAALLGIREPSLLRLERSGHHEDYTLSFLERFAAVIDVPFSKSVAALSFAERPLSNAELARGLGWSVVRVQRALRAARAALDGTGLQVRKVGGETRHGVRLREELLSARQRSDIGRAVQSAWSLHLGEARLLYDVVYRSFDAGEWERLAGNDDWVKMRTLLKRGLVTRSKNEYKPAPAVARALRLI
jgi:transcriptional regulator with XRE-family HTH domain